MSPRLFPFLHDLGSYSTRLLALLVAWWLRLTSSCFSQHTVEVRCNVLQLEVDAVYYSTRLLLDSRSSRAGKSPALANYLPLEPTHKYTQVYTRRAGTGITKIWRAYMLHPILDALSNLSGEGSLFLKVQQLEFG